MMFYLKRMRGCDVLTHLVYKFFHYVSSLEIALGAIFVIYNQRDSYYKNKNFLSIYSLCRAPVINCLYVVIFSNCAKVSKWLTFMH